MTHRLRPLLLLVALAMLLVTGCGAPARVPPVRQPAPAGTAALTAADLDPWLDGLVPTALERGGIPGATVAVVDDGRVVALRGFGRAQTAPDGTSAPVDPGATLFRIGSVSKVVTAVAVMQQVERGRLDLDADVRQYLDFELETRYAEPVTLRHLLTHTAGFEERIRGLIQPGDAQVPSLREVLAADQPDQVFAPGTVPAYSNFGNALAAYAVERVAGQPFAAYAQAEIFAPAGMRTATLDQPVPERLRGQLAAGYTATAGTEVPFEMVSVPPAGSVSASAADMAAFMQALLGARGVLLNADSWRQMQTGGIGPDGIGNLAEGPQLAIGLYEQDRNGRRILGHAGDTQAFHSDLQLYPETGTGIFISMNGTGAAGAAGAVRAQLMNGFADRYFPDRRPEPRPLPTSAEHAEVVAGRYQPSRRVESNFMRVTGMLGSTTIEVASDGSLVSTALTDDGQTPVRFVEVEPWVFAEVGGERRMAVQVDDGEVTAVGIDPTMVLQPMPLSRVLVLPVLVGVGVVTVLSLLLWPVAAAVRRRAGVRLDRPVLDRRLDRLTRLGQVMTLLSLGAWAALVAGILSFATPPELLLRAVQVLTVLALLGLVPALWRTVRSVRGRRGWLTAVTHLVVVLAFLGLGYVAVVGGLLLPSVSY